LFDERLARRDAARYRRRGLRGSARRVLEQARGGVEAADVLEIGGGVGSLSIELVRAGARHATVLELSSGYGREADALLREGGLEGRVEHRLGDVVTDRGTIDVADLVVMERVVCCYPDVDALVGAAADHARRRLVLSYPRYGLLARVAGRGANLVQRLRGSEFRAYAHPGAAIVAAAGAHGLRPAGPERGAIWRVAAFERGTTTA
jgi:magnesium-protoporphyrin O-methyltransferase